MILSHPKITKNEFALFKKLIYEEVGISLSEHKINLVQSRLSKRVKDLGLTSFKEYYDYLTQHNTEEFFILVNSISTNVTSFFREANQWDFLRENLDHFLKEKKTKKLRIWSAACSSGEEPYSIAIFLKNHIKDYRNWDIKILATDISKKVLQKAVCAQYSTKDLQGIPKFIINENFKEIKNGDDYLYIIDDELRKMVMFRMFNLLKDDFSIFKNEIDIIFCRNVMIYFDQISQDNLIKNFNKIIKKDGWLFVGHSESLARHNSCFKSLKPSIYKKV